MAELSSSKQQALSTASKLANESDRILERIEVEPTVSIAHKVLLAATISGAVLAINGLFEAAKSVKTPKKGRMSDKFEPKKKRWNIGRTFKIVIQMLLPYLAAIQLGGLRTAMVVLCASAVGAGTNEKWRERLTKRLPLLGITLAGAVLDLFFSSQGEAQEKGIVYLFLLSALFGFSKETTESVSKSDDYLSASAVLLVPSLLGSLFVSGIFSLDFGYILPFAAAILIGTTENVAWKGRVRFDAGLSPGLVAPGIASALLGAFNLDLLPISSDWALLLEIAFAGSMLFGAHLSRNSGHSHNHDHDHSHDKSAARQKEASAITKQLLKWFSSVPLLHSIIAERDSRRILYFMW